MRVGAEVSGLLEVLRAHEDDLLTRWTDDVARPLRGRAVPARGPEAVARLFRGRAVRAGVRRDLAGVWHARRGGIAAGGTEGEAAEFDALRSLLTELSGTGARQGFTAREATTAVLALKD